MIRGTNLHKRYNKGKSNEFHALKGVDFQIEDGELLAIVGKSGAGKSTLLHILGAVDDYDEGSCVVDGTELKNLSSGQLAKFRNSHVGIILQDFALIEGYTVAENVMIPLHFSKHRPSEYRELILEALREVDIEELADKDVNKLSGGQKQRVAIARAIVNDPKYILADEPTGALDTASGMQIMELFRKLNAKGKTVIIITHDLQVAAMCKRTMTISDGQIVVDNAISP